MATRHDGTDRQGKWRARVLRGRTAYYAVPMSGSSDLCVPASYDRTLARCSHAP